MALLLEYSLTDFTFVAKNIFKVLMEKLITIVKLYGLLKRFSRFTSKAFYVIDYYSFKNFCIMALNVLVTLSILLLNILVYIKSSGGIFLILQMYITNVPKKLGGLSLTCLFCLV